MEKIKFVMTDTDAQVSELCRQALEEKGVAVTVCEKNGNKALEALLNIHPNAVLLDAFMPDLDAITVKQRYEAQNTSNVRTAFFVTGAFQSEEIEQELLDNGFSFFFVKPFDESVLVNGQLDMSLVNAIAFDTYTHGYYKVTDRVGEAFQEGLKLKK